MIRTYRKPKQETREEEGRWAKKVYMKPVLKRLGLLRRITRQTLACLPPTLDVQLDCI
jgi:hypothetical protein